MRGSVEFEVKNGFGERLINLCAKRDIPLWRFRKTDEGFAAYCRATEYHRIEEFAVAVNVETRIIRRHGLPSFLGRYRKRYGIFLGLTFCLAFLFFSQCFIWKIDINGNQFISEQVILSELEGIGIKKFSFIPGLDFKEKKREALLGMPQLSWLAMNQSGCVLRIDVAERVESPLIHEEEPCDIIASKTGQVRMIEVYRGTKVAEKGYPVCEGDLLVSGIYATEDGKSALIHADAKVIAEVQFSKSLSLDLEQAAKRYTGKTKKRYAFTLFSLRMPLYLAFPVQGEYDVHVQEHPVVLFGKELPVGMESMHYHFYDRIGESMSREQAAQVLKQKFVQYEAGLNNTVILSRNITERVEGDVFTMTIDYVAEQDIAKPQKVDLSRLPKQEKTEQD